MARRTRGLAPVTEHVTADTTDSDQNGQLSSPSTPLRSAGVAVNPLAAVQRINAEMALTQVFSERTDHVVDAMQRLQLESGAPLTPDQHTSLLLKCAQRISTLEARMAEQASGEVPTASQTATVSKRGSAAKSADSEDPSGGFTPRRRGSHGSSATLRQRVGVHTPGTGRSQGSGPLATGPTRGEAEPSEGNANGRLNQHDSVDSIDRIFPAS